MALETRLHVTYPVGSIAMITAEGRIDVDSSRALHATGRDVLLKTHVKWIIVDAGRVEFIDSSGLAALVTMHARLQPRGGGVAVVSARPNVLRAIEISGEDQRIRIFPSLREALPALAT